MLRFHKAHGTGNDFVVLPDWDDVLDLDDELVRLLCDRRLGIGADGVIRVLPGDDGDDAFMDHRNADGSRPEMCGNGVRVVAKHVVDHGLVFPDDRGVVRVGTRAGTKEVSVRRGHDGRVRTATVDMGPPTLDARRVPFRTDAEEAIDESVEVGGRTVAITAVSMGNPHAVVVVDDVDGYPVAEIGAALEGHERFPAGVNVEFIAPRGREEARVRVWERGVGETAACGTGACAALVGGQQLGILDAEVVLAFPGGDVTVRYDPDDQPAVLLTGGAVEVARGEVDTEALGRDSPDR